MSKQPPPAPTASAVGPCPTLIKIVGRPGTGSLPSTIAPSDHPSTNLDKIRARAHCACSRCGWGWFGHFFSRLSFVSSSLWEIVRHRLKHCLKGPLNLIQLTNQLIAMFVFSSPGRSPGRAIVLPPASSLASELAKC